MVIEFFRVVNAREIGFALRNSRLGGRDRFVVNEIDGLGNGFALPNPSIGGRRPPGP